jgi:hypothetical protein
MIETGLLEQTCHYARVLSAAHLPTLASFYLSYLWSGLHFRPALADLCEVLLDAGGLESLPSEEEIIVDGSAAELELLGYVEARRALFNDETAAFLKDLESSPTRVDYSRPPAELARSFARAHVSHADVALQHNQFPVPFEVLDQIVKLNPGWRYAARVLAATAAAASPKSSDAPLQYLDLFVAAYGNDFAAWYEILERAPSGARWLPGYVGRLLREVTHLPHDKAAWASLAVALNTSGENHALDQTSERVRLQQTLG